MFWQQYWTQCPSFSNISITSAWWIYNRAPQLLSELKQGLQTFVLWVERKTLKTQQTGVYWFLAVIFRKPFFAFLRTMFPPAAFPPLPSLLSGGAPRLACILCPSLVTLLLLHSKYCFFVPIILLDHFPVNEGSPFKENMKLVNRRI